MIFLAVAVVALTILVAVDLVLSTAVVRRLRELEARIDDLTVRPSPGMELGESMPEFVSESGELAARDLAGRRTLIGFFATGCRFCPAQAERLADRSDEIAAGGVRVVNVLTGDADGDDVLTPTLRKAGLLLTEQPPGTMMPAFQVGATPTFLLFDERGVLAARGNDLREVLST